MDSDSLRALETSGVLLLEMEEMEKAKAVSTCKAIKLFYLTVKSSQPS